jgi:hypothetical protein
VGDEVRVVVGAVVGGDWELALMAGEMGTNGEGFLGVGALEKSSDSLSIPNVH